jgi:hypothetical protein
VFLKSERKEQRTGKSPTVDRLTADVLRIGNNGMSSHYKKT